MRLIRSILLTAVVAVLVPLSAHALRANPQSASLLAAFAADTQRLALHVEGMTCGGCAISTRVVLNRLEGVRKAEVNFEQKRALVTYDASKVTPPQMIAALKGKLGYNARVVETGAK